MKFPRNTRLLRSPFEVAPFAAVFFLFAMFLVIAELMPTPGIPMQLPMAADLPGIDKPSVGVAVDASGRCFFESQLVNDSQLQSSLRTVVKTTRTPLTLVIHADRSVTYGQLVHLTLLARSVGIQNALLATMPRPDETGQP